MSARMVLIPLAGPQFRQSARVARVAVLLDCDESQIRRLIYNGSLEAHRQGKRGVRVYLDSVEAYRARQRITVPLRPAELPSAPSPTPASKVAHRTAMAELRARRLV